MGRHTGPVEKLERREGVDLGMKGARRLAGKTALERRGAGFPGVHGNMRRTKTSVYSTQLRQAARLKVAYGVREKQFRRYIAMATKRRDVTTGEALMELLERRLDNTVYRLGFANTRAQARQFISHGHVQHNGRRVDIPSALVDEGSIITLTTDSPIAPLAAQAAQDVGRVPTWLQADHDALAGKVLHRPTRAEIAFPVDEQQVVERYARR